MTDTRQIEAGAVELKLRLAHVAWRFLIIAFKLALIAGMQNRNVSEFVYKGF